MSGFALVNATALIATWFFIPSLPVTARLSYGQQLQVLKKPDLWLSIAAVVFMNGAVFGVFGYFSGYLTSITGFSWNAVSLILLVYGLMNIAGNFLAGRLLSSGTVAERLVVIFPAALGIVYAAFFWGGSSALPMAAITLLWGVLGGMNANINQYWIATAAPEAADFANGLFLTAANLGTALGSVVCGMVIARIGMQYVMWGGVAFLVLCWVMIIARVYRNNGYFYQRRNGYFCNSNGRKCRFEQES
ncbi:MAG: MFS transporter [Acidaminococcaceae bacterium]|nr:MFS transporter [Acidaminococcaceae bacterium]